MASQPGTKIPGADLWVRMNKRGHNEYYVSHAHKSIDDLFEIIINIRNDEQGRITDHMTSDDLERLQRYIVLNVANPNVIPRDRNTVPHYPRPVEFHVSRIAHVTTEVGLRGVLDFDGFTGGTTGLLWWGLMIDPRDFYRAEERYLEKLFPDLSQEKRVRQKQFLHHFTTSPVFKDESRYGNFRFSFSLAYVLQEYSTQFCSGQKPVFRVYETIVYKQEIMYSVLIHSPDDEYCKRYKRHFDIDKVLVWCAQAISETHGSRLVVNEANQQVYAEDTERDKFYVWDHMTLAFYMPTDKPLTFPLWNLREALTACDKANPQLNRHLIVKSIAEDIIKSALHEYP